MSKRSSWDQSWVGARGARTSLLAALAGSMLGCGGAPPPQAATPQPPVESQPTSQPLAAAETGQYRNLFVEGGHAPAEVKEKLQAAYRQLFHGDPANEAVMLAAGSNEQGPLAYVKDVASNDVRSEGMSYGMMIAVQMDQRQDFDALWNWAHTHMLITDPSHPVSGYFAWQMKDDGTPIDEMPAPDGEEYFAMALLFAANRWGSREGIYDYRTQALDILSRLIHRGPIQGTVNGKRETTAVALFNPEHHMVRFTPDKANFESNGDHTDPSYHLPAFYELWAQWGPPEDSAFWHKAAQASRDHFVAAAHPKTGLTPDYSNFDGSPKAANWDENTVNFRYDAWRTAMNWSFDYAWWAKDPRQVELSNRLLGFFSSQGDSYGSVFQLDGTVVDGNPGEGLISTNAVMGLAASVPEAKKFVEALYRMPPPTGKWRYYGGMLYMLSMLHASGEFRVWHPTES